MQYGVFGCLQVEVVVVELIEQGQYVVCGVWQVGVENGGGGCCGYGGQCVMKCFGGWGLEKKGMCLSVRCIVC